MQDSRREVFPQPVRIRASSECVRRMQTEQVASLGGRPYPVVMTMRPLDQPGQWTRVETSEARFNVGIPANLFTLSNLQNPRP